jgi:hypothetical protein
MMVGKGLGDGRGEWRNFELWFGALCVTEVDLL